MDRAEPKNALEHMKGLELRFVFISCGSALCLFLFLLMGVSEIGFFFGLTISPLTFVLAVLLTVVATALLFKERLPECAGGLFLAVLFVLAACLLSSTGFDYTVDGNTYHKQAVALLRDGWNPLQGSVEEWPQGVTWGELFALWIDHYAQGVWCIAAAFYSVCGDIEISKCYTFIAMASAATLAGGCLSAKGLPWWQATFIALVAVINPITIAQAFSFYIDAFLMMGLLLVMIGLAIVLFWPNDRLMQRIGFAVIAAAFILCAETKFTGLAYAGVFSLAFYILVVIKVVRGKMKRVLLLELSIFFAVVIVSSVLVFGFSPYVTNLLDHGNPFYPLLGEGAVDIMTPQSPSGFPEANQFQKLFLSFFSQTAQLTPEIPDEVPILKVPLTVYPNELPALTRWDIRIGGFGVLYSAILILQTPVIVLFLILSWKKRPLLVQTALCYLIPTCILMVCVSESWWARYSMYFYFTTPLALLLLFAYPLPKVAATWKRVAKLAVELILSGLVVVNLGYFVRYGTFEVWAATGRTKQELNELEQRVQQGETIQIWESTTSGHLYRLVDRGIPFEYMGEPDESEVYDDTLAGGYPVRFVKE